MVSRPCFSSEGCWGSACPPLPSSGWGLHPPQRVECPQPPSFGPRRCPGPQGRRPSGLHDCDGFMEGLCFPEASPVLEAVLVQLSRAWLRTRPAPSPSPQPDHTGLRSAAQLWRQALGDTAWQGKVRQASLPAQDSDPGPHLLARALGLLQLTVPRFPAPGPLVREPGPKPPRAVASRNALSVFPVLLRRGPGPAAVPVGSAGEGRWACVRLRMRRPVSGLEEVRTSQGSLRHLQCSQERGSHACGPQVAPRTQGDRMMLGGWSRACGGWS